MAVLDTEVLVVDDYRTMRHIVRNLLQEIGFSHIEEAADGNCALTMMRGHHYGLVISDRNMAPMNGLQLLQQVRSDAKLKDTPFIMVTAASKVAYAVEAVNAGVSGYLVKPFTAETLKERIELALSEL